MVQLSCIKRCILAYHRPALFVCNAHVECGAWDVLVKLSSVIDSRHGVTKFNISRGHVQDGTRRAILHKQYSPRKSISVKFTDEVGQSEGAVDQGGPKRELLQLLINYLASASPMFMSEW